MDDAPCRRPVIGAHIHLWDLSMRRRPWFDPSEAQAAPFGDLARWKAALFHDNAVRSIVSAEAPNSGLKVIRQGA
jgi:predicted TIM-barrel fold metal-dependent hydrolase